MHSEAYGETQSFLRGGSPLCSSSLAELMETANHLLQLGPMLKCMHSACTHIWPTGHVIVRISGDLKATAYLALGSQQFSKLRPN